MTLDVLWKWLGKTALVVLSALCAFLFLTAGFASAKLFESVFGIIAMAILMAVIYGIFRLYGALYWWLIKKKLSEPDRPPRTVDGENTICLHGLHW